MSTGDEIEDVVHLLQKKQTNKEEQMKEKDMLGKQGRLYNTQSCLHLCATKICIPNQKKEGNPQAKYRNLKQIARCQNPLQVTV